MVSPKEFAYSQTCGCFKPKADIPEEEIYPGDEKTKPGTRHLFTPSCIGFARDARERNER